MFGSLRGPVNQEEIPHNKVGPQVLVTGVTGISGSHIALVFARAGYSVVATTRSPDKAKAFDQKWPGAIKTWHIIGDQSEPGVYDEAVEGCEGVIHCAGPFNYKYEFSKGMIDASVQGILNVFNAASKKPTVKRIVHISSVAAIHQHPPEDVNKDWSSVTYDETCFNLHELEEATGPKAKDRQYAYTFSKKYTELQAAAWLKDNKHDFDTVTINPSTCYGPLVQPLSCIEDLDTASSRIYNYILTAKTEMPKNPYPAYTAVVDLAQIVLRAYQTPVASGQRYQITSGFYNYSQVFSILRKAFPEEKDRFPEVSDRSLQPHFNVDVSKVERDLGVLHWTSIEDAIVPEFRDLLALEKGKNW